MTRSWRTIIAGLLAFWMPLCCCQIAAIAGTGAPCCAAPAASAAPASAESCCAPKPIRSCCEIPAADSTCGAQPCDDSDRDHSAPEADTCTCCATKAPVPEQDPVDPILSARAAADAIPASMLAACAGAAPVLACNGPPDGGCGAPWLNGPWPCAHATERCAQLSCWTE